jgi:NADH:ubiquinone oxidoreductase subunit F (NADH-binding)
LAAKLAAVAGRRAGLVVANGAESEPASRKDAVLLAGAPHLVLDGAATAAELVGADEVVVWLHDDPLMPVTTTPSALEEAIAERSRRGVDGVLFSVRYGPARYVAGESSAVVRQLSGGPAVPTRTPPHATERGVFGRPTLLSNVETLAQLALLARGGPAWFGSVGTPDEAGTVLVTLTGAVGRPTVAEVPFGTTIGGVLDVAGLTAQPAAVLVGGYAGTWLPWTRAAGLQLTSRTLRAAGASLGVGLLGVLPRHRCGLAETARLVEWLAGETAGQCGPCVNGLPSMAGAFRSLADGEAAPGTVERLHRWSAMVTGRGLCHHPDGVAHLVRSALRVFEPEVRLHLDRAPCRGHGLPPLLPVPGRAAVRSP